MIEKVTGHHVADVINRRVLRPAHLERTLFPDGPNVREFPEPHAHGYTNQTLTGAVTDSTDWNPSWAWSAYAMISTCTTCTAGRRPSPPAPCSARRPRSSV